MRSPLLLAALLSASEWTIAQSNARPDPADPRASAPSPSYQPAFSDYQPFRDEKVRSWKEVNQEVADNPSMGSVKHGPGMTMPGMDSKSGDAPKGKEGAAAHEMGSMKDKPAPKGKGNAGDDMRSMQRKQGAAKPAMAAKSGGAATAKGGTASHELGSMHHKPDSAMSGMDKPAATAPKNKDGHDVTAIAKPQSASSQHASAPTSGISGTGAVQGIDKANGKVKLTHEPIAAMGWPRMTMFFRLKESSLADQVKVGDKVGFTLEKSTSGYVISSFQKLQSETNPAASAPKPAAHSKH